MSTKDGVVGTDKEDCSDEYQLLQGDENDEISSRMDEEVGIDENLPLILSGVTETELVVAVDAPSSGHRRHRSLLSFFDLDRGNQFRRNRPRTRSNFRQSISHGLGTIVEGVDVRDTFVAELREADRGDLYFLDMGMTRNLSVLPDDLHDFVEEATGSFPIDESSTEKAKFALGPLLALLGAVIAVSSNGTALSLQKDVAPPMKLYWRMTATAACLSFFAVRNIWREGCPKPTFAQQITFMCAVGCFALHALLFVTAIQYTTIGNAVIFANSQALLLLAGKAFIGTPILCMEAAGAFVAFSGAILCASGEASNRSGQDSNSLELLGDGLAMVAAVCGVSYLTFAKSIRSTMNVTLFMFLVMFSGSFLILAFMLLSGVRVDISLDPDHGIFGWLTWRWDRLLTEIWIVLVCSVIGTMGFVRAMQHFDNLIIAVATLMEPMVASLIAYGLGVGELPGLTGWIGNLLVAAGTIAVVYPSVDSGGGGGH